MMKYILQALLFITFISGTINAQTPASTIPEFKFYRMDQTAFTDKDLPNNKKIFFVFFDSDCDHCQRAVKSIGEQYNSFKQAAVYLVSIDSQDKINHFMDTYGQHIKGQKNVLILQDKGNQFISKFQPKRYPSMFLYSKEKTLLDYEDNPETVFRFIKPLADK